jgi:hypothetical protein
VQKNFLTFFPLGENEHLAKDAGVILNIMAKNIVNTKITNTQLRQHLTACCIKPHAKG